MENKVLKEKIIDERTGIEYRLVGDYYIPNITIPKARRTGNYISHQIDLLKVVSSDEQVIVATFLKLKTGGTVDFKLMSETLFVWSKKWIAENRKTN